MDDQSFVRPKLFRSEALTARRRRLLGEISIRQPYSFGIWTASLTFAMAAAIVYASVRSFPVTETANGWIVPQSGMAQVYAPAGATVDSISVEPGQPVKMGDVLARLSTRVYSADGAVSEIQARQTAAQLTELQSRLKSANNQGAFDVARLTTGADAADATLDTLRGQQKVQEHQVEILKDDYERLKPLLDRGFVSKITADTRLQSLMVAQQTLMDIQKQITQATAQAASLRAQAGSTRLQQQIDQSTMRSQAADLRAKLVQQEYETASLLRSPVDGSVASVNLRPGEVASAASPVAVVAPRGRLTAELLLPTRSAGFARIGDKVDLRIDAFPFARYGTVSGRISQISHSAIAPGQYAAPISFSEPVYRVVVAIPKASLMSYGEQRQLTPGMTLKAEITTDRRSLLQWLFDPVRALGH